MDRYYIIESSPLSPNTVDIVDGQTGKFVASESAWIVGDEGWLGREARHNALKERMRQLNEQAAAEWDARDP